MNFGDFKFKSNYLDEKSILDISMLVKWNKVKKKYNFNQLPKTAIISISKFSLEFRMRLFSKKVKGILGNNYFINNNLIFCSGFGYGAPAIIGFMEELRILGVENFVFVGFAGSLVKNINENDTFLVNNSFSTVGCTALYSSSYDFKPIESDWRDNFKALLNLPETICWSTDAPYRETKSLIKYYIDKRATHVDMECAAIYAFAEFYKLNSSCILITADSLAHNQWSPPKNLGLLNSTLKKVVTSTIEILNKSYD